MAENTDRLDTPKQIFKVEDWCDEDRSWRTIDLHVFDNGVVRLYVADQRQWGEWPLALKPGEIDALIEALKAAKAEAEKPRKDGLEPYQVRMLKEHDELFDRWIRISSFIETSEFKNLPAAEQDLLYEQHLAMSIYLRILKKRIGRWAGKAMKKKKDDSQ